MRRFRLIAGIVAAALALASVAHAQSGGSCPIGSGVPTAVTANKTLAVNDQCGFFVVTSNATISIPAAGILPPGYYVWVKAQGATATVTPTTAQLDGATTSISVTTGDGIGIRSDGTNAFSTGLGVAH